MNVVPQIETHFRGGRPCAQQGKPWKAGAAKIASASAEKRAAA